MTFQSGQNCFLELSWYLNRHKCASHQRGILLSWSFLAFKQSYTSFADTPQWWGSPTLQQACHAKFGPRPELVRLDQNRLPEMVRVLCAFKSCQNFNTLKFPKSYSYSSEASGWPQQGGGRRTERSFRQSIPVCNGGTLTWFGPPLHYLSGVWWCLCHERLL